MKTLTYKILALLIFFSCSDEYLEKKSDKSLVIPSTVEDLQALLDNSRVMNTTPGLVLIGSDNLFTTDAGWLSLQTLERNSYIWAEDLYEGDLTSNDWNRPYETVFYANVVLGQLAKLPETEQALVLKGSALFYRAHAFFHLAQLFAAPYGSDGLGIPLRLTADINAPVVRASVDETYDRMVMDLTEAAAFLPEAVSHSTRPSRPAAYGLLARVYLLMEDYVNAEAFATKALELNNTLFYFNELDASAARPFPRMSDEVVFYSSMITYRYNLTVPAYVDQELYARYADDDIRKEIFFRSRPGNLFNFKGSYTGLVTLFSGIGNDEVYLMRAECRARTGNAEGALEDINTLLETRWRAGTYVSVTETNPEALLELILQERRKELVCRGLRWMDLRRLNKDARFQETLTRTVDGTTYTLPPNDSRYVYTIPQEEIMASGIEQNIR